MLNCFDHNNTGTKRTLASPAAGGTVCKAAGLLFLLVGGALGNQIDFTEYTVIM